MSSERSESDKYAQGGYIGGSPGLAWIHPDECLFKLLDVGGVLDVGLVCVRPDHDHTDEQENETTNDVTETAAETTMEGQ